MIINKTNEVNSFCKQLLLLCTHTRTRTAHTPIAECVHPGLFWVVGARMHRGAPAMRPGRSSHTQAARFPKCLHTIEFLTFSLMFEIEKRRFPLRSAARHPRPIEKESEGHQCLVYICSKQENMLRFDSQKIRRLLKSA